MTPYRVHNTGNNHDILHRRSSAMVTAGDGADDLTVARCVSDRTAARSPPDRIAACVQCAPRRERRTAVGRT